MMRLRDWPPRRIGLLWIVGCAVEALLIGVLMLTGEPPMPHMESLADSLYTTDAGAPAGPADSVTISPADVRRAMEDAGFIITREPLPSGDTLVRIARDSSFLAARVRHDTITVVAASPDVQRAAGFVATAIVDTLDGLAAALLLVAAILLPIPILLFSVTLTWAVQRRLPRT